MFAKRLRIAIGPEMNRPSWNWMGYNLCRELGRYFDMRPYPAGRNLWECDAVMAIREPIPEALLGQPRKIIYMPCDYYQSEAEIQNCAFLPRCSAVVCHSRALASIIQKRCACTVFVPQDSSFVLPKVKERQESGPIVWIGFSSELGNLAAWVEGRELPGPLIVLTDRPDSVRLPIPSRQYTWTQRLQFDTLRAARAGIDAGGKTFAQLMAPPNQLKIYIASGIPAACDPLSGKADTLRAEGFQIAPADDPELWLSSSYYERTLAYAATLREEMSLGKIGETMRGVIESCFR